MAEQSPGIPGEMAPGAPTVDPQRQRLAKRYAQQKRALLVADVFLALAYLFGWQIALSAGRVHVVHAWAIAALFAALLVGYEVVTLPMSWVDYQLSRGYGLSTQAPGSWFADQLKGIALMLVLGGIVVELTYFFMRFQPDWWWLIVAGILFLFTVLLANLAPVLIAPMFYRFTPLDDPELTERLLAMARRAGARVRGVFTIHLSEKTTAANAALMGWGNTRRIVVGDTLTQHFTDDEAEAVLAHELGHHVHHDVWKAIGLQTVITLVVLWLTALCLEAAIGAHWLPALADAGNMPALALLFGFWSAMFVPLSNWASRVAERHADEYAIRMATRPVAFAHSMIRLANQNLAEIDPPRLVEILLYDHPAIQRRIAMFEQSRRS